jgi:hypothetical protein
MCSLAIDLSAMPKKILAKLNGTPLLKTMGLYKNSFIYVFSILNIAILSFIVSNFNCR